MARLGDTVADLLARARSSAAASAPALTSIADFGLNPGELRMRLHAPKGLAAKSPLVVVLHGCAQTADDYAAGAGWVELADRNGFAVLCPEQTRANNANLCFNWFEHGDTTRGGGEAASIAQMTRRAVADFDLDPDRVFVTGLSAGGAMAAVMLATYPELFAAGAVIAGLPYGSARGVGQAMAAMRRVPELPARAWGDKVRAASPSPARWPRVSVWAGDADTTVTPAAAQALVLQWCDVHGCPPHGSGPAAPGGRRTHQTWRGPDGGVAVELHRVSELGHGTPISTVGVDGCGAPGPWLLDVGVSSSLEIARSWGIAEARRSEAPHRLASNRDQAASPHTRRPASPPGAAADTISSALRRAGLLR